MSLQAGMVCFLTVLLVGLKLTSVIDLSWMTIILVMTSPLWVVWAFVAFCMLLAMFAAALSDILGPGRK